MGNEKQTPFNLPVDMLVRIINNSGNRSFSQDILAQHIKEGFKCNEDGTVDLFDYVSWLIGDHRRNPPPRTPPQEMFNLNSVNPAALAGWLTLYNHFGYEVTRGRIVKMFQTFGFKFKAKDNERNIDFIKFAAFATANKREKPKSVSSSGYLAHKAEMARRNKEASAMGRDIGELPEVANPVMKHNCEFDFKLFCETYFSETFALEWSDDHLRCIAKIENSILEGGLFALAMPRGSGKALALDTPLPTPTGWTTMGEVKVGDTLFDENGYQCRVILKSEVFTDHKCYEVTFNDGSTIVCDADHLWQVEESGKDSLTIVKNTQWLADNFEQGNFLQYCIKANGTVKINDQHYHLNPVRFITDIHEVPTVKTQCVMVDSPSHLYLAGKQMIPTHNTSLCEISCIWALLYGHRKFVTLIGASESAALEMLDSLKIELETNEMLAADFPEVCFPIASLEGIANRCNGQTYHGVRTRISWTSNELILPTIEGSRASGNVIRTAGLTGRIRGMKYKRPDGKAVRPDLVVIDDPQTRESAKSLEQNKTRIKILSGDVLGLAGPSKKISGIMPCTVIEPGDMADTILDREKHPEWNGERAKMMYELPINMELWDEYAEIYADSLREEGNFQKATDFYLAHQEEMDKGAVVAWKSRYNQDEVSAIQNAMNIMLTDPVTFRAEYQNEPLKEDLTEESIMSADAIAGKLNGIDRFIVPLDCTKLTMFVDVQKKCLFYTVCAWTDDFSGAVIDYGTYPQQRARRFSLDAIKPSLQDLHPHASIEAQLFAGMKALFEVQLTKTFIREDGAEMRIEKAAIDANWGVSTDIVYQYCRQSEFSTILQPSHGKYVGASSRPMTAYKKKPGERMGLNWYIPAIAGKRAIRHVIFDTNFWKSFVHSRLNVAIGESGCLTLWGKQPLMHELFSEHLTAEYKVRTQGRDRTVDEWRIRPGRTDNHWLDCLTGCAMLASQLGSALPQTLNLNKEKKPVKLSESKQAASMPTFTMPIPQGIQQNQRKRIKLSEIKK